MLTKDWTKKQLATSDQIPNSYYHLVKYKKYKAAFEKKTTKSFRLKQRRDQLRIKRRTGLLPSNKSAEHGIYTSHKLRMHKMGCRVWINVRIARLRFQQVQRKQVFLRRLCNQISVFYRAKRSANQAKMSNLKPANVTIDRQKIPFVLKVIEFKKKDSNSNGYSIHEKLIEKFQSMSVRSVTYYHGAQKRKRRANKRQLKVCR